MNLAKVSLQKRLEALVCNLDGIEFSFHILNILTMVVNKMRVCILSRLLA